MTAAISSVGARPPATRFWRQLHVQVIGAIALGVVVGYFFPAFGAGLKPLGDAFVRLIRMLLVPVVFGTIVVGIARMENLKEAGRVGLKALLYFELVSTVALALGLLAVNLLKPGVGMNIDPHTLDTKSITAYTAGAAQRSGVVEFLLNIIPNTIVDAFARGEMLQVLLVAILMGVAMARFPGPTRPLLDVIDGALHVFFGVVGMVMWVAPIGAFGAMAFTVGAYGIGVLGALGQLLLAVYGTCAVFVFVVLGAIARSSGFSLGRFLRYIREEIAIVFATSSTEAVFPRMVIKLENLGCAKSVVGLVLPAGYVFNPDGTAIYLTMAAIFVAQATNTSLTLGDQLFVLGMLMVTSKGSAGVAGGGFIALAATLSSVGKIPVAGIVLLLGVERFINAARAITNLIGNGVATVAIARWEKAFDSAKAGQVLAGVLPAPPPAG